MWRFVILAVLLLIVYFMVRSAVQGFLARKTQGGTIGAAEMVQDPVCGMYVTKEGSFFLQRGDQLHFFCSETYWASYEKKLA